ncbi:MAG: hypothetical protein HC828_17535 [Blastochloris sp.]|nr:hypothetical protein [Blastochloris sp.]
MRHETLWIFNRIMRIPRIAVLALMCSGLTACALFEERTGPQTYYGPRDQVYYATFEEVWRAVNLVLQPYPLRVSNMDQGILETDVIRGYRVWAPVYKNENTASGETYHLTIRVIKGALEGRPATKVTIVKEGQMQVDFFSDPKILPSDGLEEKSLLYRVGREIQIERALAKAQKKQNQKQQDQ